MLKLYSDIHQTRLNWLWYPYIAFGKITILQGNPGNGKSHVGISLAAALSSRGTIPNGTRFPVAQKVIYQCAEDGLADTIKPRLVEAGADCRNVAFRGKGRGYKGPVEIPQERGGWDGIQ